MTKARGFQGCLGLPTAYGFSVQTGAELFPGKILSADFCPLAKE
jgi:hypothetical protein